MGSFEHSKTAKRGGREPGKIDASLNKKLQSVEWGEYRLGDLFEIGTGSLLSANELVNGKIPRISAKSESNGILGYFDTTDIKTARHFENFISVNFFGTDGGIFYHPYKASVEMKVHTLKIPNYEFNILTGTFIASSLKMALKGFGYGNQLSSSKLRKLNFKIQLPTRDGKIDFEFMESFIAELEAQRIAELEAYLLATGLKDYQLTAEEEKALKEFETKDWIEFAFQDIFNQIVQGRRLKKDDQLPGNIPFVMSGVTNTGVVNYISNPVASFPANSITVDIFGNTFYRNYEFGAGDDTGVYWNDKVHYAKETMLFFTTAIGKSLLGKFSYGKKLRSSQSFNFKIQLPTCDGEIDFEFMKRYISAVQKLVIKGVVQYADKKIEATRVAVGRSENE